MNPTRTYRNDEITVEWWADRCTHCRACVMGLPAVFQVESRPWVNLDGATSEEVEKQVEECPSGALLLKERGQ